MKRRKLKGNYTVFSVLLTRHQINFIKMKHYCYINVIIISKDIGYPIYGRVDVEWK